MMASLVAQMVKTSPAMQSLGWEDPLEKKMATHSSILAWRIPWMEESGGPQSTGSQGVGHDWATDTAVWLHSFMWDSISDQVTENTSFYNCNNLITKY